MREKIIQLAKRYDADLVGFAPASRFEEGDPLFRIFPEVKTVIGLGFRVLRGIYRTVEEGTTYYQYTTMGVENMEETVMPLALLNVSNLIEEEGFEALPQRKSPLITADPQGTNPEVDYRDVYRGVEAEPQLDFVNCAVQCGLGERGLPGNLLTPDFGPFIRYCFILTDAELEPTPLETLGLCDGCGECIKACPGKAIAPGGERKDWQCAVYYNGAAGFKNPFMPPDALSAFEDRLKIINGEATPSPEEARSIIDQLYFYPPAKHSYRTSICGRACDRACYIHLEEKGVLKRNFNKKFRTGADWRLDTKQFETGEQQDPWQFSNKTESRVEE